METMDRSSNDPRDDKGLFGELMQEIKECKEKRTCPQLKIRCHYFEPNSQTVNNVWKDKEFYRGKINNDVMFFCESPGGQKPKGKKCKDNNTEVSACWVTTSQDDKFEKARESNGFKDCYITNSVKCGVRKGSRHTDEEIDECSKFMLKEIILIKPRVVIAMGANAYFALKRHVKEDLPESPVIFKLTHYSAREDIESKWKYEFEALKQLLHKLKPRDKWFAV